MAAHPAPGRVRDDTIARLEAAMGALGTAAMLSMDRRLPWFRSHVRGEQVLARPGRPGRRGRLRRLGQASRSGRGPLWPARCSAPRRASWPGRSPSSRPSRWSGSSSTWSSRRSTSWPRRAARPSCARRCSATPGRSPSARRRCYARTAEARGAWDARLEALVVESLVRGEVDEGLQSWASALNWSFSPVTVIVGTADGARRGRQTPRG